MFFQILLLPTKLRYTTNVQHTELKIRAFSSVTMWADRSQSQTRTSAERRSKYESTDGLVFSRGDTYVRNKD